MQSDRDDPLPNAPGVAGLAAVGLRRWHALRPHDVASGLSDSEQRNLVYWTLVRDRTRAPGGGWRRWRFHRAGLRALGARAAAPGESETEGERCVRCALHTHSPHPARSRRIPKSVASSRPLSSRDGWATRSRLPIRDIDPQESA